MRQSVLISADLGQHAGWLAEDIELWLTEMQLHQSAATSRLVSMLSGGRCCRNCGLDLGQAVTEIVDSW